MARDNEFDLDIGKIGARDGSYLQHVLRASNLARGGGRKSGFKGNRLGRGAAIGPVVGSQGRLGALRRRVVIKARIVKLRGKGFAAPRQHLRYIQRDGVTREGAPGELYNAERTNVEGRAFLEQGVEDRHQFRFIVAAEDGAQYQDLKPFVRKLMTQMEEDLGTELDWVAVDHFNTGHPHTHIVLRGKDDKGRDLVIAPDYISRGLRERASDIVTFDLGPKSELEIEGQLRREVEQERFTSLDRGLIKDLGEAGIVLSSEGAGDALRQTLRAGRLQKLRRLGLAAELEPGRWRLVPQLEPVLRRMGERGDIIHAMHQAMAERGRDRPTADYAIYDPQDPVTPRLVGRIAGQGLADELGDRHYVIVDGVDGRAHYVDIGKADPGKAILPDSIVSIMPKSTKARSVDRTVAEVAAAHDGHYSVDIHLRHDSGTTAEFAGTHVRRLEAIRRLGNHVSREPDGTWIIAPDHVERAHAYELQQARLRPVILETLSAVPLERQVRYEGATWLDKELVGSSTTPLRNSGFGREAQDALGRRRLWLMEQDLAHQEQDQTIYRTNMLGSLRRRELARAAVQLAGEVGLPYKEAVSGDRVEGLYRRSLDLASGRYAVIEKTREFTLVPWRSVLERNRGQAVAGIMREDTISWTIGRQRSGPSIP
ncbi:MAG: relaxase/mobilization nuclease RlxS [Pseudomonadota bacterium]